ncbi:Uncharacterized protein TCM_026670 [Theobroma cacao]|uniref:Uncharacterized protein n=1 Tax=Theobroma cacao TaxID=3641 RepID=A0A061F2F7_THECC|nr:Uncharacterized protein TCM_026670 [Theobroma cacao]
MTSTTSLPCSTFSKQPHPHPIQHQKPIIILAPQKQEKRQYTQHGRSITGENNTEILFQQVFSGETNKLRRGKRDKLNLYKR